MCDLGPIKDMMKVDNNSSFFLKFAAGSLAGAIGSTVSNPNTFLLAQ